MVTVVSICSASLCLISLVFEHNMIFFRQTNHLDRCEVDLIFVPLITFNFILYISLNDECWSYSKYRKTPVLHGPIIWLPYWQKSTTEIFPLLTKPFEMYRWEQDIYVSGYFIIFRPLTFNLQHVTVGWCNGLAPSRPVPKPKLTLLIAAYICLQAIMS